MGASDWLRDEVIVRSQRCEIAQYPTAPFTQVAPPCGRPATWWSDDIIDGGTVWMCDECCREVLSNSDGISAEEIDP